MDLFNHMVEKYGYDEPIFLDELTKNIDFMKPDTLRQNLSRLVKAGKINRYKAGIYFVSDPNAVIKSNSLNLYKIISKRYILNGDERIGYLSGLSFANSLRLTTQNPVNIEVVSLNTNSNKREIDLKKAMVTVKKPKAEINNSNYKTLQVLDLLSSFDKYSEVPLEEAKGKIIDYVGDMKIPKKELNEYLNVYPKKAVMNLLESELYDEITL